MSPDDLSSSPLEQGLTCVPMQLKSTTWTPAMLSDHTMLPLGVNPSHLS